MISHIVVPLDGSAFAEEALGHAAELARATNARVTLAAVMPRPGWAHVPHITELDATHRRLATEYLASRASELQNSGVTIADTAVLFGEVADALRGLSDLIEDVDLVVMSTHGIVEGAPSHARDVLMASPAPVLMIRGGES